MKDLFTGDLVHLTIDEPETLVNHFREHNANSEYLRLADSDPAYPGSLRGMKEWLEKRMQQNDFMQFSIHTLDGDRLIGDIDLNGICWNHADTFVGIGIGHREFWGKGYGTDAMRLIVRYAFLELNLHRVTLNTFEYNPRAIRSYEKVGFKIEGRERQVLHREGRRWDLIYMGILREEWMEHNGHTN